MLRYLLLQDLDTGDVLMPLLYLKKLFVSNYSRKLSNPKHRLVHLPEDHPLLDEREQDNPLHWVWAFESTSEVKAIVRQELGESAPQVPLSASARRTVHLQKSANRPSQAMSSGGCRLGDRFDVRSHTFASRARLTCCCTAVVRHM